MVDQTRILEKTMGDGIKKIEKNEKLVSDSPKKRSLVNKRCKKNENLTKDKIIFLRPCPRNSIDIFDINKFIGRKFRYNMSKNSLITKKCLMK